MGSHRIPRPVPPPPPRQQAIHAPTEPDGPPETSAASTSAATEQLAHSDEDEAATAPAARAMSGAESSEDQGTIGEEEIAIGGHTLEHADVELSLTHDDRGLNTAEEGVEGNEESAEEEPVEDEGETAPSIVLSPPNDEVEPSVPENADDASSEDATKQLLLSVPVPQTY